MLGLEDSMNMKEFVSLHSGFKIYTAEKTNEEIQINALEIAKCVLTGWLLKSLVCYMFQLTFLKPSLGKCTPSIGKITNDKAKFEIQISNMEGGKYF